MSAAEATQGQPERFSRDASTPIQTSIWKLPGIDKVTFYAAAIYLHVALGTIIDKNDLRLQPSSVLDDLSREFLDRLADCFARSGSKLKDARDHVSAAAMVRKQKEKKITVYIAKNKSYEDNDAGTLETVRNENEVFAEKLVKWLTDIAQGKINPAHNDNIDDMSEMFKEMCAFSRPRLEYYIDKISKVNIFYLQRIVERKFDGHKHLMNGWVEARVLIEDCEIYQTQCPVHSAAHEQRYLSLASLAGRTRKNKDFKSLTHEVRISDFERATEFEELSRLLKWISYLGRHYSAHDTFLDFCKAEEQDGLTFQYRLLPSREQEDEWNGTEYIEKIHSWTGDLDLTKERNEQINKFKPEPGDKTKARVHCEMQLLMHFSGPNAEKCEDYFGCSKKSCWLCWQMILQNGKYTMKDTHRKLFPRWAFPFNFSPSAPEIGEGLAAAYYNMLSQVQKRAIREEDLVSPDPFPHTSTRETPWLPRLEAAKASQASEFSYSPIIVPDRQGQGKARVPALLLPSNVRAKEYRQVEEVEVYIKHDDLITDFGMRSMSFKGHPVVSAFQLITRVKKATDKEFDSGFWHQIMIFDLEKFLGEATSQVGAFGYTIYYRSDMDNLVPNPTISQIWKDVHGHKDTYLPWRGDVLVFKDYSYSEGKGIIQEEGTFSTQDALEFFETLESYFQLMGNEYLLAEIRGNESVKSNWLERVRNWRPDM